MFSDDGMYQITRLVQIQLAIMSSIACVESSEPGGVGGKRDWPFKEEDDDASDDDDLDILCIACKWNFYPF